MCHPDLDERMKAIEIINSEEDGPGDSFAQRAESYYRKRPQLLSLLHDLYNGYLSLSDRYLHGLAKQCIKQSPFRVSSTHEFSDHEDGEVDSEVVQSSLSYQKPPLKPGSYIEVSEDVLIAELVMKNVEHDLMLHEVDLMKHRKGESSRKIQLQQNLLEVLESERMTLQGQNAALGYQVAALVEENQELATESELMKNRAEELAKCVWKIREEGCVGELRSKIDELQGRVLGLEEKNREYYSEIIRREMEIKEDRDGGGESESACSGCFEFHKWKLLRREGAVRRSKAMQDKKADPGKQRKASTWWAKIKKMGIFECGR